MYQRKCSVYKIVDGDTVWAQTELGFGVSAKIEFRFTGINCPEKKTPAGQAALAKTSTWFAQNPVCLVESVIIKKTGAEKREYWQRFLGTFRSLSDPAGKSLNEILVEEGHAVVYKGHAKAIQQAAAITIQL